MFGHHILTITLIVGSYVMNFTQVGVLIHCLMDFCDILLPVRHFLVFLFYFFILHRILTTS